MPLHAAGRRLQAFVKPNHRNHRQPDKRRFDEDDLSLFCLCSQQPSEMLQHRIGQRQ